MKYTKLIKYIEDKETIEKDEIYKYYSNIYKNDNIKSFENVITYFKNNNIISETQKNKYIIVTKKIYKYKEDKDEKTIYNIIKLEYPEINFIVWNTSVLNEFTLHYVINNYIVVEVEKIAIDLVVNLLKINYLKKYTIVTQDVFNNNKELFYNDKNLIIVKTLHVKSPLKKSDNKKYISIEKIMADLYVDKLYIQYQGEELKTIYQNIFETYDINLKKLIKYIEFRTDINKYKKYLNNLNIPQKYKIKEE